MAARLEFTNNNIRSMVSKYKKGATVRELAEEFSTSTTSIIRLLTANGVTMRPRGRRPANA